MELLDRAKTFGWYHTLELAPGHVTEGMFDLRPYVQEYKLPERLDGMRCLDVGTWDGFWAFEMERRGAAEVVALDLDDEKDLDWPPRRRPDVFPEHRRGEGFRLARELFDSNVERVNQSIYTALAEDLGQFDLVFCGSVIIHLRDQLLALERITGLTKPGGVFVSAEEYNRAAGLVPFAVSRYRADRDAAVVFWQPSVKTWKRLLWTAGFDTIEEKNRFNLKSPQGFGVRHVLFHAHKAPA
ncbi:MAG: methyltransferase domain-containing protein [Thermoleophilaceae bacterium]